MDKAENHFFFYSGFWLLTPALVILETLFFCAWQLA